MASIHYATELNAEQLAAVQAPDGPVLVIAAAGTGKTRTLTYRVAWLVEHGVEARRILLMTFTNRAAHEMLERATVLVGGAVGGLWGGTFHHMANRMLRRHAGLLGYKPDYTILDQDDAKSLVKTCAAELKLAGKEFPKADVLLSVFSLAANVEKPVREQAEKHFADHHVSLDEVLRVHQAYEAHKRQLHAMDFDDLLVNGLRLFREHPEVLARYQEQFEYILVDEYQDTNTLQAEWVDRLAAQRRNLLVVGDDFQSIYSWRGANFANIISFPQRYAGTTIFKLVTNYRSVPEILDLANACIAGNPEQFQKTMKATRPGHKKPTLVRLRDGDSQARYVVERIRRLLRQGRSPNEIAVLYRAHFHAMELQMELTRQGIPFIVTSGVRFFEQAHVKDVCALVRVLVHGDDQLAFVRLLGLLPKIGEKTALKIFHKLGGKLDLADPDTGVRVERLLPEAAQPLWRKIEPIIAAFGPEKLGEDPGEIIYRFLAAFYEDFALNHFENAARRLEDLQGLINFTTRYESAEDFLSEIALLTNLDAETEAPDEDARSMLKLSTVHQAKGLEWPVVFLLWMNEGLFPSQRSLDDHATEAEERRLFYVATTRAKDDLVLCVPEIRRVRDGGVMPCIPSRFITEVPLELFAEEYVGFI
ncbi:MAG: ATP-dependent helicase [Verrucomicrobia bacterium]|nr:MAG: ATP-dependent helicase [Verrucomicrobiota bacterium]